MGVLWVKRIRGPNVVDITPDRMYSLCNALERGVDGWDHKDGVALDSPLMAVFRENEQLNKLLMKFLKAELTLRNANALESTGIPDYSKTVGHAKPSNMLMRDLMKVRNQAFDEYEIMRRLIAGDVDYLNVLQLKVFFV